MSVDVEAEGVEVLLPKEGAGGEAGVLFEIGKAMLLVGADVKRLAFEAPEGSASVEFVRCSIRETPCVSCVLINLGVADAAARVTILRGGSVVVVVGGRQRGRGRGVCGSEGASGEGRDKDEPRGSQRGVGLLN